MTLRLCRPQEVQSSCGRLNKQAVENLAALRNGAQAPPHPQTCMTVPECVLKLEATDKRIGESRIRLAALEGDLVSFEAAYAPVQGKINEISKESGYLHAAIIKLRDGLGEWIAIHHKLGDDIRKGLQPNVRQLIATAGELKKLVDEMRKAS
jgi:hypothetical protein